MATSKLRNRDMSVEREIAKFLDKHLYSSPVFIRKDRTDTIEKQMLGSDILLSVPSQKLYDIVVDEKAQTQYINKPLPTFSLELSFKTSSNQVVEGWFTDKSKLTEYYLFQWIHKADTDWNLKAEDIKKLEYALVSRTKIADYLSQFGYTIDKLRMLDVAIRESNQYGQHNKESNLDFWFFLSTNLAECPINIVIRKKVLLQLAELKGIIEP